MVRKDMLNSILVIFCLIVVSVFFLILEILLVVLCKIKLKLLVDEGNVNVQWVLKMQENLGIFFIVVQIGFNVVVIFGGIVGDVVFLLVFYSLFSGYLLLEFFEQLSFIIFFILVISLFILFVDLILKCIGMIVFEIVVLCIINLMCFCLLVFCLLVWLFNGMVNMIFCIFKLLMVWKDDIIFDDIYVVVEVGVLVGVLCKQEYELIENVFELEFCIVFFFMILCESVIWFDLYEDEQSLKNKVVEYLYLKFFVCNEDIDYIIGYVDLKDLLNCVLVNQSLVLIGGVQICNMLIVLDILILLEVLESFKIVGEDFVVIMNEYVLVVGIIIFNDVMIILMGDFVGQGLEEQIVVCDENLWLIDGGMLIDDVMCVLDIDEFLQFGNYEIIGGFMMFMLCKIFKCIDVVKFFGYKFEVVDIDNYCIDQLLVICIDNKLMVLVLKQVEMVESQNV